MDSIAEYILNGLVDVAIIVGAATIAAIMFVGVTCVFQKTGLIATRMGGTCLYGAYVIVFFAILLVCFLCTGSTFLEVRSPAIPVLILLTALVLLFARSALEERGFSQNIDCVMGLMFSVLALVAFFVPYPKTLCGEVFSLTLEISAVACGGSFLVKKAIYHFAKKKSNEKGR
ncbi:hypothetical protein [Adlercreutzia muris]|uniref:Uncharacterized protein n=1 Tax=Adlercreutzia muris TaxID=1796610 RepID=A0A7C8BR03_9ACTN|nr:hypothetical protein [Adlercreutzia muris]MCI9673920.1 hypothetical protein [Enterorhabdus sp.]TGY69083.1 hypothetical protein E5332_09015 [Enterorhabdus sp. NM05_H27]KAB1648547.1 hypothetical protein F8D48_05880 [Adlercreutzia muris]MCR2028926.1 hypothetical protein [Adlercreutzia muris]MCU7585168.1 hypothetical protein [Adlercreutzia muris]